MGDPALLIDPRAVADTAASFQMVSLLKLAKVTEEGVRFLSPHDGSPMLLTPEHSMSLQNSIGSDIMMQLDDVIVTTSPDHARMKEAMERSVRWLDRCIKAHKHPERQNLFCIIQGGLDLDLRRQCTAEMVARDTPGIAIGGLSGGEEKSSYCKVVDTCTSLLPEKKPRYVMGVGYPEDLVVSVALGADMFDCVWPTRTAVSMLYQLRCRLLSRPAFRKCHHRPRRPQHPQCSLFRRLWSPGRRLQVYLLSPNIRRWLGPHTRLHVSRHRQRNRRCPSFDHAQRLLPIEPHETH